tara:strand:- start:8655 stop:9377 length:723 start_codon:yes stop_codon:yes gene_type:complete
MKELTLAVERAVRANFKVKKLAVIPQRSTNGGITVVIDMEQCGEYRNSFFDVGYGDHDAIISRVLGWAHNVIDRRMPEMRLFTVRNGTITEYEIERADINGWWVKCDGTGDMFIGFAKADKLTSGLEYYEYNRVTTNRDEAMALRDEQLSEYASHLRIEMMNKLNRPIVDVVEITHQLEQVCDGVVSITMGSSVPQIVTVRVQCKGNSWNACATYKDNARKFEIELAHAIRMLKRGIKDA